MSACKKIFAAFYVLVSKMFEQLELSVGSFGEDGCREGLHDLLDGDGLLRQLVLC